MTANQYTINQQTDHRRPHSPARWMPNVIGVIALLASVPFWGRFNLTTVAFVVLVLAWFVFQFDSKIFGQAAIGLLALIPILLVLKLEAIAESVAVYVYFLLVLLVLAQIIEMIKHRTSEQPERLSSQNGETINRSEQLQPSAMLPRPQQSERQRVGMTSNPTRNVRMVDGIRKVAH